jgi:hypothetical protein
MSPILHMNNNLTGKVETLKSSTLFYLSLGSKELFHSNFLEWLTKKYPKQVGTLFAPYLAQTGGDISVVRVERELKNVDLHVYFANGQELIVENKVRSLPFEEQLQQYGDENQGEEKNFLLLTLVKPQFAQDSTITSTWQIMSYADLAKKLSTLLESITDSYDSLVLRDYIMFITALDAVFVESGLSDDDYFTFYSLDQDETLRSLKELRMADVYLKLKYQQLAVKVYEALKQAYPDREVYFGASPTNSVGSIHVKHGMFRAQGLAEVFLVVAEGLYLTVQIQDCSYRQMVQGYDGYGKESRQYADYLKETRQWFTFNHIDPDLVVYPKNTEKKEFNKYGDSDFYRNIKLSSTYTVGQIVDFVLADVGRVVQNQEQLIHEARIIKRRG